MLNKKTKALAVAGAGAAVLVASGATFALWSATESVVTDDIRTGSLSVEVNSVAWEDVSSYVVYPRGSGELMPLSSVPANSRPLIWQPAGENRDLLVPGDTITGQVHVSPDLDGTNLVAELTISVAGVSQAQVPNVSVTATQGAVANDGIIEITIAFDSVQNHEDDMSQPISLDGATVTLQQVRPNS